MKLDKVTIKSVSGKKIVIEESGYKSLKYRFVEFRDGGTWIVLNDNMDKKNREIVVANTKADQFPLVKPGDIGVLYSNEQPEEVIEAGREHRKSRKKWLLNELKKLNEVNQP